MIQDTTEWEVVYLLGVVWILYESKSKNDDQKEDIRHSKTNAFTSSLAENDAIMQQIGRTSNVEIELQIVSKPK